MKADINKRKKVFKFLGIDKSYVNSLCPIENSKDFVFEEDFKNKFTTLQDLDNLIEEKYYWEYMGDVPFQMIYPFLSQFEFHDKDDFFDCVTKLKKHVKKNDAKELKKIMASIKREHSLKAENFEKDKVFVSQVKELRGAYKDKKVISFLREVFNDEKYKDSLVNPSVYIGQEKISQIFMLWLFLRKEFKYLNIVEILKKGNVETFIVEKIKERLNIEGFGQRAKKKFFNEIYDIYVTKGFLFHGTNESYLNNIKKFGLTGCNLKLNSKELIEIDNIMRAHDIEMSFEGKIKEITHIKYYTTLNIKSGVYYATQSPEFLSRFCGNGYALKGLDFDNNAFWRRDFKSCLKNVETVCDRAGIIGGERQIVVKNFKSIWKTNVKKNKVTPIILLIPKKAVGLDRVNAKRLKEFDISHMSYNEIFFQIINLQGNFVRRFSNIPKNSFEYVKLPCTPKLIKTKTNVPREKYCEIDSEKMAIDGIINIKETFSNAKTIFINLSKNELILIFGKNKNIISLDRLKKLVYFNKPLDILLAERGIALSEKFSVFLKKLREQISIKTIQEVNLKIAKNKINEGLKCLNNDYQHAFLCYAQAVFCLSSNVAMKRIGKHFAEINEGFSFKIECREVDDGYWGIDAVRNNKIDLEKLKNNLKRIKNLLLD